LAGPMTTPLGGRPSKGERGASKVRFPLNWQRVLEAEADELGLPFSDLVVMKMAQLQAAEATGTAERKFWAEPDYITQALRKHERATAQGEAFPLDLAV
jgi:hypothetical protein